MNPSRARRAADLVIAASREAFPNQDECERVDQAVKALGHLCPEDTPFNLVAAAIGASALRGSD